MMTSSNQGYLKSKNHLEVHENGTWAHSYNVQNDPNISL
jgi:hypothetical protein